MWCLISCSTRTGGPPPTSSPSQHSHPHRQTHPFQAGDAMIRSRISARRKINHSLLCVAGCLFLVCNVVTKGIPVAALLCSPVPVIANIYPAFTHASPSLQRQARRYAGFYYPPRACLSPSPACPPLSPPPNSHPLVPGPKRSIFARFSPHTCVSNALWAFAEAVETNRPRRSRRSRRARQSPDSVAGKVSSRPS